MSDINTAADAVYDVVTDYGTMEALVLEVDGGSALVASLEDHRPVAERGDTSWVPRVDVVTD